MDCSFRNVEGVGKALKDPKISPPNKEKINQQLMHNLPLYVNPRAPDRRA